jgi:hypothetical protein
MTLTMTLPPRLCVWGSFSTGVSGLELHYLLVRNSGHMVPAYVPQRAAHVLEHTLVGGAPLAPPLPDGWDVASDEQFYARGGSEPGIFAKWVQSATTAL